MDRYPLVARLSGEMVALGRDVAGLEAWVPTAAFVQRYRPGALGITPHLDGKRFGLLVAAFTTKGSAQFSIHETGRGRW
jgi:alkylated DNA repair dioxygenase AlkB